MAIVSGVNAGKRMCEILGIEPNKVRTINLTFEPGSIVSAHVELVVDQDQLNQVETLVIELSGGDKHVGN